MTRCIIAGIDADDKGLLARVAAGATKPRPRSFPNTAEGVHVAIVFPAEMGDLSRFGDLSQVAPYVGLVPWSDDSGEHQDRKGARPDVKRRATVGRWRARHAPGLPAPAKRRCAKAGAHVDSRRFRGRIDART